MPKLVKYYFWGVFLMIGLLIFSVYWQYQQFQNNIKDLSNILPKDTTQNIQSLNFNDEMHRMLNQSQMQTQAQANSTSTKEFKTPDGKLIFKYSSEWQEANKQLNEDNKDYLLYLYNINTISSMPAPNYLIVRKLSSKTEEDAIDQYRKDIQLKDVPTKVSEIRLLSEQGQWIPVLESDYKANDTTSGLMMDFTIKTAFIDTNDKIYLISIIITQNDMEASQKANNVFESIKINN